MKAFKENLEALASHLEQMITSKCIVGEPIVTGNVTVLPVMSVSVGFGLAGGEGDDEKGSKGSGGGGGVGFKVAPCALLVIRDQKAELFSLGHKSSMSKVLEMLPEVLGKLKSGHEHKCVDEE